MIGWIELPYLFAMPGAIEGNMNVFVARCAVRTDQKVLIKESPFPDGKLVREVQLHGMGSVRTPISYERLMEAFSCTPGRVDESYVLKAPKAVPSEDQEPPKSEIIVP